jgi:uncharacterized membrane protein YcaP (DUF421 family)
MELHRIAIRALFAYFILLGLIRVSGKRTLAQATPFDFVLTLILGDMIDDALWAEVPLARFVVAVGALTVTHLLVSWASSRSERLDRLIDGASTAGIDREDWPEVRAAHVECSGGVSVILHEWARPVQRKDGEAVRRAGKLMP